MFEIVKGTKNSSVISLMTGNDLYLADTAFKLRNISTLVLPTRIQHNTFIEIV